MSLADKMRELRAAFEECEGLWRHPANQGKPPVFTSRLISALSKVPDPEEVAKLEDAAVEHRDCPVELRMANERRADLETALKTAADLQSHSALTGRIAELAAALRRHCWAIVGGRPCFCKRSDKEDDGFHRAACAATREALKAAEKP